MARNKLKAVDPSQPETRNKILDAAIACVKRWGIEKVTLNDIAREAGVTRPTVYSYFANRDEVVQTALLQSAYAFGEKLLKHVGEFQTPSDRVIEAVCYALQRLPREPYLAVMSDAGIAALMNQHALSTQEGQALLRSLFRVILEDDKSPDEVIDELAEVAARLLLSLLTLQGASKRSQSELKGFLERRLLPALGLC